MQIQTQRVTLAILSGLLAAAVLASLLIAGMNRSKQSDIAQRSQFIQQSVALERLNQEIIRALAELALRSQDKDVTALLNANGVTFSANAGAGTSPAANAQPQVPATAGTTAGTAAGKGKK